MKSRMPTWVLILLLISCASQPKPVVGTALAYDFVTYEESILWKAQPQNGVSEEIFQENRNSLLLLGGIFYVDSPFVIFQTGFQFQFMNYYPTNKTTLSHSYTDTPLSSITDSPWTGYIYNCYSVLFKTPTLLHPAIGIQYNINLKFDGKAGLDLNQVLSYNDLFINMGIGFHIPIGFNNFLRGLFLFQYNLTADHDRHPPTQSTSFAVGYYISWGYHISLGIGRGIDIHESSN